MTDHSESEVLAPNQKVFAIKKWNMIAVWSWDVQCDVCAICRNQLTDACLRCQGDSQHRDCFVVWGECNHTFHNCCMTLWIEQSNRCPLCQLNWQAQRISH